MDRDGNRDRQDVTIISIDRLIFIDFDITSTYDDMVNKKRKIGFHIQHMDHIIEEINTR